MVGQFTHIVQHFTAALTPPALANGTSPVPKTSSGKNPAAATPDASSTTGSSSTPDSSTSGPNSAAATTTLTSDAVQATQTPAATPKPPLAQLPLTIAQVPLTALDLVKAELPVVVAAVPLPGLAALPVFADALINPIQDSIRGLATATSNLPFLQYTPGMTLPQLPATSRALPNTMPLPSVPKVFAAGADPLPRDFTSTLPAAPAKPTPPAKPQHVFAADDHVVVAQDFRPGYPDYLRAAGLSEVAAVAVPGFAGIITLTAAGGLVGYRQARAHSLAPHRAARFVN